MKHRFAFSVCIALVTLVSASFEVFGAQKDRSSRPDRNPNRKQDKLRDKDHNRQPRRNLRNESRVLCQVSTLACGPNSQARLEPIRLASFSRFGIGDTNLNVVPTIDDFLNPVDRQVPSYAGYRVVALNPPPSGLDSGFRRFQLYVNAATADLRSGDFRIRFLFRDRDNKLLIIEKKFDELQVGPFIPPPGSFEFWRTITFDPNLDFGDSRLISCSLLEFEAYLFVPAHAKPNPVSSQFAIGDFSVEYAANGSLFGGGKYVPSEISFRSYSPEDCQAIFTRPPRN